MSKSSQNSIQSLNILAIFFTLILKMIKLFNILALKIFKANNKDIDNYNRLKLIKYLKI